VWYGACGVSNEHRKPRQSRDVIMIPAIPRWLCFFVSAPIVLWTGALRGPEDPIPEPQPDDEPMEGEAINKSERKLP
jgi:hypothetical protein